jgi:hypothetical protein
VTISPSPHLRTQVKAIGSAVLLGALAVGQISSAAATRQDRTERGPRRVTIPFLASTTRPSALEYEAAACDISLAGDVMTCRFQQVFLTVSSLDPQTCLITTNGYERTFNRDSASRWLSVQPVDGECGILDTAALDDGGGVRWTMTLRKVVTKKDASPACREVDESPEAFNWQGLKRPLPCSSIQPGDLSR